MPSKSLDEKQRMASHAGQMRALNSAEEQQPALLSSSLSSSSSPLSNMGQVPNTEGNFTYYVIYVVIYVDGPILTKALLLQYL